MGADRITPGQVSTTSTSYSCSVISCSEGAGERGGEGEGERRTRARDGEDFVVVLHNEMTCQITSFRPQPLGEGNTVSSVLTGILCYF